MDDFLLRALFGGGLLALIAGPFGCFLLWRRMAFFGDTLSHAALLGVAGGLWFGVDVRLGMLVVCAGVALSLAQGSRLRWMASDTLLSIFAHSALAMGMVALAFIDGIAIDLMSYLFGDVLAISMTDIYLIAGAGGAALACLIWLWPTLLAATVSEEIAHVEGGHIELSHTALMVLTAIIVGLAIKIVGVLLITALLIIPAAAARPLVRAPEAMAILAGIIGCFSVAAGLVGSYEWDLPAGPAIVVAATVFVVVTTIAAGIITPLLPSARTRR